MIRILTKFGLSSSLITGAFFVTNPSFVNSQQENKKEIDSKKVTDIKTLEDIGIYEKEHRCSFVFISKWKKNQVYNAKEFVRRLVESGNKKADWVERTIEGANREKSKCQKGKTVALEYKRSKLSVKT